MTQVETPAANTGLAKVDIPEHTDPPFRAY